MSTHKYMDKICCLALLLALVVTGVFLNAPSLGIQAASTTQGYESRLFDTSRVHTIDIVMDDWEGFLEGCTDEEYELCSVVIDNESYNNVAIRAKGKTTDTALKLSLTTMTVRSATTAWISSVSTTSFRTIPI